MRLQNKLFLSLVVISSLLVTLMLVLMQWSVARGMLEYVNVQEEARLQPVLEQLAEYYRTNDGWAALQNDPRQFELLLWRSQGAAKRPPLPPPVDARRPRLKGSLLPGKRRTARPHPVLLDNEEQLIIGRRSPVAAYRNLPIVAGGETIGWLAMPSRKRLTEGYELNFIERQLETLLAIGLLVIGLALVFAFLLSRHLLKPISALTTAASDMTRGDYAPVLDVQRGDELGQLARDFNGLAASLHRSDAARKRWFADVSHELRTPLAILYAEIEAMLDGIRPVDKEAIRSLQQEVGHLGKLVDDLNTLSNADLGALQYHKEWLVLGSLVEGQIEAHGAAMAAAGLELQWVNQAGEVEIWGDQTRLCQLLDNLLVNSRKYTDAPGQVRVTVLLQKSQVVIIVEDSAPGVPGEALKALFDHLYRVDASRNRATGGSGLGLAICRRIVEGHDGKVEAQASSLGGLAITVRLPREA